jgi:hypothetical protein
MILAIIRVDAGPLLKWPLVSVPDDFVLEINANRLSRWQFVQAKQEQIWPE